MNIFVNQKKIDDRSLHSNSSLKIISLEEELQDKLSKKDTLYVPYEKYKQEFDNVKVYTDLESYAFFDKLSGVITQRQDKRGVLRLGRKIGGDFDKTILVDDLIALSGLFGKISFVKINHSQRNIKPMHVSIILRFMDGVLANLDYTFNQKEDIFIEWSGINEIIEYDSAKIQSFKRFDDKASSLYYDVNMIVKNAYEPDQDWMKLSTNCLSIIEEGLIK
ncbi:hypothetical protein GCM10012290_06880 [Halolactibacillus alkaliphilus]|uniref:Uncharacterized protein n=1 Tax=Halolactibacillus alkaliphilus TaxID=442899 RepID=A0A511WZP4_9BACI|nr:hypothetical protein [Halolactibacillus alkaliphilus]GEN56158.1 hypothetical protein HAL01_06220 [Halolactibacillus alkaliphilus]GGN66827.1 hypothetical protein GCM10012290_06880 [Halolactibacillus alkaliphilus]SFO72044.1 hypothetical protein SAMN05720591_10680 [Halolactibacillus alkaliphilus]